MFVTRILTDGAVSEGVFAHNAQGVSLIQRIARDADPELHGRLFRRQASERYLGEAALRALGEEIKRLTPWVQDPRRTLTMHPPVSFNAGHGKLYGYARDPALRDDVRALSAHVVDWLSRDGAEGWRVEESGAALGVRRSMGTAYRVSRLCIDETEPDRETEEAMGRAFYEGLVRSALREPDALGLLERVPALRESGFHLEDAYPASCVPGSFRKTGRVYYDGLSFDVDLELEGPWSMGTGQMFGYGRIYPDAGHK